MFSRYVAEKLHYYVYRLMDPRNGETFYVGKGKGNRVFAHAKDELGAAQDALTEKLLRIRKIRLDGFEVTHVIHRHGLTEEQAFEVEAALIDAYPEVANEIGGRASDERGLMHATQVIERYEAPKAKFGHKVLLININRTVTERASVYEAVRSAWKIDPKRAAKADLVLAVQQGLIVGVFIAGKWHRVGDRWEFVGHEALENVRKLYLRKRVPESMNKRGAANPIRYVGC